MHSLFSQSALTHGWQRRMVQRSQRNVYWAGSQQSWWFWLARPTWQCLKAWHTWVSLLAWAGCRCALAKTKLNALEPTMQSTLAAACWRGLSPQAGAVPGGSPPKSLHSCWRDSRTSAKSYVMTWSWRRRLTGRPSAPSWPAWGSLARTSILSRWCQHSLMSRWCQNFHYSVLTEGGWHQTRWRLICSWFTCANGHRWR